MSKCIYRQQTASVLLSCQISTTTVQERVSLGGERISLLSNLKRVCNMVWYIDSYKSDQPNWITCFSKLGVCMRISKRPFFIHWKSGLSWCTIPAKEAAMRLVQALLSSALRQKTLLAYPFLVYHTYFKIIPQRHHLYTNVKIPII